MPLSAALLALSLLAPATGAASASPVLLADWVPGAVEAVARGNPLRSALLDTLRPTVEGELGAPVEFVVDRLDRQGPWAFAIVDAQRPGGGAIDIARTRYAEAEAEGMFDGPRVYALLHQRRPDGPWEVLTHAVGPTDVVYATWPEDFGAPAALFGM